MKKEFIIPVDYINGYLKDGNILISLTKEEIEEYNNLTNDEDKEDYLNDRGEVEIVNYSITSYGLNIDNHKKLSYD